MEEREGDVAAYEKEGNRENAVQWKWTVGAAGGTPGQKMVGFIFFNREEEY